MLLRRIFTAFFGLRPFGRRVPSKVRGWRESDSQVFCHPTWVDLCSDVEKNTSLLQSGPNHHQHQRGQGQPPPHLARATTTTTTTATNKCKDNQHDEHGKKLFCTRPCETKLTCGSACVCVEEVGGDGGGRLFVCFRGGSLPTQNRTGGHSNMLHRRDSLISPRSHSRTLLAPKDKRFLVESVTSPETSRKAPSVLTAVLG